MKIKLQAFKQRQGHDIGGVRPVMIPDDAGEWVSRHDAKHQIERIIAQRDELLAVLESFSNLYGRLWDLATPEGTGFLSAVSVKEYDNIHEQADNAIARIKGGAE